MKARILLLTLGIAWLQPLFAAETLIMTAPPRESQAAGEEQYAVTAEYISEVLDRPVEYEYSRDWLHYQRHIRNGTYDIVFDGPHFASWRVAHVGHEMLVRLPGNLQFHLLTAADNQAIDSPEDMIGKTSCGISPPNLSTLSVLARFRNPVRQPVVHGVKGGMGAVYKAFKKRECDAFVVRTSFYQNVMNEEDRQELKIVYTSDAMPNQSISASDRLTPEERAKLRDALLSEAGTEALRPALNRFAKKAKGFIATNNDEFEGYNTLLEGVIFGW
ncbi:phosphate/phosphite/phosphonate ABC transporter substrate-binding protein [Thiohalophilus thiocyanatoxydans]|uniref:ABC-type phosphate/phosphonate transport system substrate-binding protein n=1 Tax=Thiohalophilus thiocyanatoxydans TaxID=381308 RepID=A0A4R8J100_9GAMM|nr:PhnD/SsuA/transferrin family substrate-binding protein [Thiohalophilus thiocyanatoxydans]TDY03987.1 ABC-type phosphate/phosphonate transport system substrate-binding protein [Thiohalophilus thiocyanatoxydans]